MCNALTRRLPVRVIVTAWRRLPLLLGSIDKIRIRTSEHGRHTLSKDMGSVHDGADKRLWRASKSRRDPSEQRLNNRQPPFSSSATSGAGKPSSKWPSVDSYRIKLRAVFGATRSGIPKQTRLAGGSVRFALMLERGAGTSNGDGLRDTRGGDTIQALVVQMLVVWRRRRRATGNFGLLHAHREMDKFGFYSFSSWLVFFFRCDYD